MKIKSYKIHVGTNGFCDIKDLTPEVREKIDHSGIREGQATVFVVGSTAGLTTVEYEPGWCGISRSYSRRLRRRARITTMKKRGMTVTGFRMFVLRF